ncbi:MAG: type II toxin-antitoxin system PemK/MazF family toxin [Chlorobium sp.]
MKNREIWLINLEPTIGAEIKKTRPAIIVSNNEIVILKRFIKLSTLHFSSKHRFNMVLWCGLVILIIASETLWCISVRCLPENVDQRWCGKMCKKM